MNDSITAVPGVRAGHWTDGEAHTGVTAVLTPGGARGAVFIPGSAPGTRELALLEPRHLARTIHGVCLAGGSAFGLAAADGVMAALAARGIGFPTGGGVVPLVPAAILFDLHTATARPGPDGGQAAAEAGLDGEGPLATGRVGAGAGAMVGGLWGTPHRGGVGGGAATVEAGGDWTVGVVVALNAAGTVRDPDTGAWRTGPPTPRGEPGLGEATTLAVVATDAPLDAGQLQTVARMASAGMARAIVPAFTPFDGDIVFALSTAAGVGAEAPAVAAVGHAAAELLARAIISAVGAPVG